MFDFMLSQKQIEWRDRARDFISNDVSADLIRAMDADEIKYPRQYLESAAKRELLGLRFDPQYGGGGMDWATEVAVIEEIGVTGAALGCLYSLVSIVGEALHIFGTPQQKERYLAPMIRGELTCAEALTEPRGGSDFFGATTIAKKEGDTYYLTGQKRFVVGGEGADIFLVYARTAPLDCPDPHHAISAFIVEREAGIKVEHLYGLMGTRGGGTARISFQRTPVKAENIIYRENQGFEVFNQMMIPERMTSASGAIGAARAALEIATRYSTKRKAFGKKIKNFQGVNFKIADSISKLDAARAMLWTAARQVDSGQDSRRLVSEAKKIATDTAWEVVNHSMQIMGGIGYTNVFPVEKLLRDIRLMMIWTGTNEIMNTLIQHEWYKERAKQAALGRDVEFDTLGYNFQTEKVYE